MPGFDGTGPMGMGPMTGGGRGFCSPWGISARGYNFPRQMPLAYPQYRPYGSRPPIPQMSREQELEFLKDQAEALKDELQQLETDIEKLSAKKKK
jgi:hypothetical protein